MGFKLICWTPMSGSYFCRVLFWKNVETFEKQPFFWADIDRLGTYHIGGYGQIGVYIGLMPSLLAEKSRILSETPERTMPRPHHSHSFSLLDCSRRKISLEAKKVTFTQFCFRYHAFLFTKQDRKGWRIPGIFGDFLRFSLL